MKTIKIIDLLNKIANGEEVPNKIKVEGTIYKKNDYNNKYYSSDKMDKDLLAIHLASKIFYNEEVEIIEEDKEIKKLDINIPCAYEIENTLRDKLNEVIEELNKVVNKINKGE